MKCSKCKICYPRTKEFFALDKQRKDGLSSRCRKCRYKDMLKWRRNNKEKCRGYAKKDYAKNKDKRYQQHKKYTATLKGYVSKLVGSIKSRCTNKNHPRYNHYKKVKVYFNTNELYNWLMLNKIDPRGLDIHRIKFDGNYSLDNIEFLTKSDHTILHNLKGH